MAFGGELNYRPSSWRRILRFAGFATVAAAFVIYVLFARGVFEATQCLTSLTLEKN